MTARLGAPAGMLLGMALLSAAPAGAQVLDRGSFTLSVDGTRIGEERFVIREQRGGGSRLIRAAGESNLKTNGATARIRVAMEATGSNLTPRRYEAEVDGADGVRILGVVTRDRLQVNMSTAQGERIRQFLPRGSWGILDRGIAHHYYFLPRLVREGDTSRFTAVIPREERQVSMRIEHAGRDTTRVAGRSLELTHLRAVLEDGSTRDVWLDGDRVMKVHDAETGWTAERSELPDRAAGASSGGRPE